MSKKKLIGFIGQGWIGKNYADDFENRGFTVVRFAMEEPYVKNREKIKDCDIVFIAVPTPTTPKGFDDKIVRSVIKHVGKGKIAVIKSSIIPGTTSSIQKENKNIFVIHSPEFLVEKTASYDASHPKRNIIGLPIMNDLYKKKAKEVLGVLPKAPFQKIMKAEEAEMVKYVGNSFLYTKVVLMNIFLESANKLNLSWDNIKEAVSADPRIGDSHMLDLKDKKRGAGGHCFIKDLKAFSDFYKKNVKNHAGINFLESIEKKNIELLKATKKDLDLLRGVYGD